MNILSTENKNTMDIEERCKQILLSLNLVDLNDATIVTPLAGGVSSDIACVEFRQQKACIKFALEKLKVSEDWYAPVKRNEAEYQWLEFAHSIVPESTPILLGRSAEHNGFVMEYLQGNGTYLWKNALLNAEPGQNEAEKVGAVLGRTHAASSNSETVKQTFQNSEDFAALRLDPYLGFTASQHPKVAAELRALITMLQTHELVLIHGDVSPKNIIFRSGIPVFLDAECATMGDPSFDVAFCLNHLVLKYFHIPASRQLLLTSIKEFWSAYSQHVTWENKDKLQRRICRLLPALMLARIDGKSPVEYLSEISRGHIRNLALVLVSNPPETVADFLDQLVKPQSTIQCTV